MITYKKTKFAGLLLGLILMGNTASASLLVEPHIGYNLHASDKSTENGIGHDYSYNGAEYGARVGFQNFGFMGGLDYTHSGMTLDDTPTSGANAGGTYNRNEIGIFAGYNLPILLRAWGAYYFKSKAEKDSNNYFKGNTFEVGVGFTALPFLSLNAVYRIVSWSEHNFNGSTYDPKTTMNEIVIGVSLPLNL